MAMWRRSGVAAIHSLRRRSPSLLGGGAAPPSPPQPWRSPEVLGTLRGSPPKSFFDLVPARSFAAPIQAKPKTANDASSGPRVNAAITVPFVRLVTDEGHSIVSTKEALDRAMKLNLDLVEVQRAANPPVCKMMDFHKEKYKQEIKEKERAKTKEQKDLKVKAEAIIRLTERGYRVKCTAMPTGKDEEDLGGLLSRLLTLIEDVSVVESGPHVDPNKAYVIVRHVKFASRKSGKKVSEVVDTVSKGVQSAVSQSSLSQDATAREDEEEEWEPDESYSETDVEERVVAEAQDRGFNKELVRSKSNVVNDFEKSLNSDARGNGIDSRPNSVNPKLNTERAKNEEPAIVDTNRYSKPNQGLRVPFNNKQREPYPSNQASPPPPYRNFPFNNKQREPYPSNQASPPPPYRNFDLGSPEQAKLEKPGTGNPNNPIPPPRSEQAKLEKPGTGDPNNPIPPPKSYGIFSTPKAAGTTEKQNTGDATTTQSYGIFSSKSAEKPSNGSSPTPKFGIFNSAKKEGSSDRSKSSDANSGNTSNQSSTTPRFGVFSSKNTATSNN
ncbi:Translation initiation factor IF-3 [Ananas comosus]|uniref:Translation initiation factor IF-3 n=1 Tax=Ananas comosus TaxID=4615 RepID=A0A199VRM9_ANACO|nr:Translation initiation factor IF-3 [Ananas comosus]